MMMRGLRLRSRSCRVAKPVSGIRLERLGACLLGECVEGDVCGRTYELPWRPMKYATEIVQ